MKTKPEKERGKPDALTAVVLLAALFSTHLNSPAAEAEASPLGTALDAPELVWTTGGGAQWNPTISVTHDGVDAAQSGAVVDEQESWLETTVTGPGTIDFWWRVSSEGDYDWLRFHIDGVMQQQISGEYAWQLQSYTIADGSHTLRWQYVKDLNTRAGQDLAWLDEVSFTPATDAPAIAQQPATQVVWEGANVSFEAIALGSPPLTQQWYLNETDPIAGASGAFLTLDHVLPDQAGPYQLVVSNSLGTATSSAAQLVLTNNGPVNRVLLFELSSVGSPFGSALANLGLSYERFSDELQLNSAVSGANPATTLVVVDGPGSVDHFNSLASFINGGGRVLLGAYSVVASPTLVSLFDATVNARSLTPQRIYDWTGSPLFTGLGSSLNFAEIALDEDTIRFHAAPGGHAVAGFEVEPTAGAAAVVIGNSGRTILNGFWIAGGTPSAEAIRLAENEILFLTGPVSATAPVIRVQPASRTNLVERSATLKVVAWGAAPLNYQWRKDDVQIEGATGATYSISDMRSADEGDYSVTVSNVFGAVTSSVATLTLTMSWPIQEVLLFRDHPLLPTAWEQALANLGLPYQVFTANGSYGNKVFEQAVNDADRTGTLLIVDVAYFSHPFPSVMNFVNADGRAILQYWNLGAAGELAAAFDASVSGVITSPPQLYDWGDSPIFSGLTSPLGFTKRLVVEGQRLQTTAGGQAMAGFVSTPGPDQVAVVLGNGSRTIVNGFAIEEVSPFANGVRLAENEIGLLSPRPPMILGQPQHQVVPEGEDATFTVVASGTQPIQYQWYFEAMPLQGAEASTFVVTGVQQENTGDYWVVLTNPLGSVTSQVARLTLLEAPVFLVDPQPQSVPPGGDADTVCRDLRNVADRLPLETGRNHTQNRGDRFPSELSGC